MFDNDNASALLDMPINADDVKEGLAADLLPAGWYESSEVAFEPRVVENGQNKGRLFYRASVTTAGKYDEAGAITDAERGRKIFLSISPEKRLDAHSKPDFMFRLWSQLTVAVGGGALVREVIEKARMTRLRFRVNQRERRDTGELEATVVAIKALALS